MESKIQGFSLIEAVVTAVIIAILSAVAIPIYTGMIRDQRKSTVQNLAETAAASANAYFRRTGNFTSGDIANLGLYYDKLKFNITLSVNTISVSENRLSPLTGTANYQ